MNRIAIIENDLVINVLVSSIQEAESAYPNLLCVASDIANVGDFYDDGEFIKPTPPPAPIPTSLKPYAMRMSLLHYNLLSSVEAAVQAAGGQTLIAWQYALEFKRTDPLVLAMAQALSISNDQMDDIYEKGADYL